MQKFTSVPPNEYAESYHLAQHAIADLKTAIYQVVARAGKNGLRNVDIGSSLGIYEGYDQQQEGQIPRTILAMLKDEGVVEQDEDDLRWRLRSHPEDG